MVLRGDVCTIKLTIFAPGSNILFRIHKWATKKNDKTWWRCCKWSPASRYSIANSSFYTKLVKNEGIINAPISHFQLKLLYKAETHHFPSTILIFHSLSIKRIIATTWVLAIWIRSSNSIIQKVHMFSKISPRDQWRINLFGNPVPNTANLAVEEQFIPCYWYSSTMSSSWCCSGKDLVWKELICPVPSIIVDRTICRYKSKFVLLIIWGYYQKPPL